MAHHPRISKRALFLTSILCCSASLVAAQGRTSDASKAAAAQADVLTLAFALGMYKKDCGRLPDAKSGLSALVKPPANTKGWKGPYLRKKAPLDPWSHSYVYRPVGKDHFVLTSYGADGTAGGSGVNADIVVKR